MWRGYKRAARKSHPAAEEGTLGDLDAKVQGCGGGEATYHSAQAIPPIGPSDSLDCWTGVAKEPQDANGSRLSEVWGWPLGDPDAEVQGSGGGEAPYHSAQAMLPIGPSDSSDCWKSLAKETGYENRSRLSEVWGWNGITPIPGIDQGGTTTSECSGMTAAPSVRPAPGLWGLPNDLWSMSDAA